MKQPTKKDLAVFGVPTSKPNAVISANPHRALKQTPAEKSMADWLGATAKQRKAAA